MQFSSQTKNIPLARYSTYLCHVRRSFNTAVLLNDSVYLMGSTPLSDSQTNVMVVTFSHDGFLVVPGDELTTFWTFFRSVD